MTGYDELMDRLDKATAEHFVRGADVHIDRLETPSTGLTKALNGGWGMGRQVLIWGAKSATKTSFCLAQAGIAQEKGLSVAYFDVEDTFDKEWAARLGCDVDELIYTKTGTVTDFVNNGKQLMQAGVDVIIVDSITALMPATYVSKDGELKDHEDTGAIGGLARSMSSGLAQLNYANDSNTLLLLVSQSRAAKAGAMYWKDGPTGGQAVSFYSSQIVKFFSSNSDKNTIEENRQLGSKMVKTPVGRRVHWHVENNKLGPQGGTGSYNFYYMGDDVGIDSVGELLDVAVEQGVVKQAGPWYKFEDNPIGQGYDAAVKEMKEDKELRDAIKSGI